MCTEYEEAVKVYEQTLDITSKCFTAPRTEAAEIRCRLAEAQCNQEDYRAAMVQYRGAMEILEQVLGRESFRLVSTLQSLAKQHLRRMQSELAMEVLSRALRIAATSKGEDHEDTWQIRKDIAELYIQLVAISLRRSKTAHTQ
jgi:tetratricopeptide (TPR) repeat protein